MTNNLNDNNLSDELSFNIGERIAWFRKLKSWSQEDFANKLGVGRSTLANYESNRIELGIRQLAKIAELLGVTVFNLLSGEEKENTTKVDLSSEEVLKAKINQMEMEMSFLKKELEDKNKIITLFEQNVEFYKNSLKRAKGHFKGGNP